MQTVYHTVYITGTFSVSTQWLEHGSSQWWIWCLLGVRCCNTWMKFVLPSGIGVSLDAEFSCIKTLPTMSQLARQTVDCTRLSLLNFRFVVFFCWPFVYAARNVLLYNGVAHAAYVCVCVNAVNCLCKCCDFENQFVKSAWAADAVFVMTLLWSAQSDNSCTVWWSELVRFCTMFMFHRKLRQVYRFC